VAIVGLGAIFPGAADGPTFWRNIVTGVDAISDVPVTRWDPSYYDPGAASSGERFYCRRGGFIDELATFDPTRYGIMPFAVAGAEPDQLLALRVASEAIADAGGEDRLGDRGRVGIILGRGGYLTPGIARLDQRVRTAHQLVATLRELVPQLPDTQLAQVRRAFEEQLGSQRPETSIGLVPNLAASRIANRLDLQGPAYTIDAACASSLIAVDAACAELTSSRCDVVLAGGVHHCHDITLWSVFTQLGALSRSQAIRPFHRAADGILIGEGTGMVVLKRLADADRDGDRVYAIIRGTGIASDGRAATLMKPRVDGQMLALERAWHAAGMDPREPGAIGLLEAHGTATPAGDQAELTTLRHVFGGPGTARGHLGLGSVKSMIGHAMPAAGIAGLIKAALAVHHGVLPPTLHCEEPHPALADTRFTPVAQAQPWEALPGQPRRAGVNAFGFGGINAHVIVEQTPGAGTGPAVATGPLKVRHNSERLLLLTGATGADIAAELAGDEAALLARDDTFSRDSPGGPARLAIINAGVRSIELARRIAVQGKPWRGRHDVWFSPTPLLGEHARVPGALAFVFPGLEQAFAPRVQDVADQFGLARPDLSDTDELARHGLGVVRVGRLLDAALREIGVVPDLVAGHSIGEWTAMIVAGAYPGDEIDSFVDSFDPATLQVPGLVFAALGCGADQAATAIKGLPEVVVSHDNCPHQSIICGEQDSVTIALERLAAQGVTGGILPFRSGFHSPMIKPYLDPIRGHSARLTLRRPAVALWSATTVAPYPDEPGAIRELITRHLLEPVRFQALTRRLYAAGVRAFVQVGTGSIASFVEDTLRGEDHLAISANTPKRSGLDQLRRVAAALWAEGLAPRFDRLAPRFDRLEPRSAAASSAAASVAASPSEHAGTATGGAVRLDLGSPLIRLGAAATELTVSPHAPAEPDMRPCLATHPVMAEFDAVLRDATSAARQVLDSWTSTEGPPPRLTADSVATRRTRASTTRTLSLQTMPFLSDHCLVRQPEGWPDSSDRHPVVPMTTVLELMADAARDLAPGHVVVGLRDVRVLRWLAVAPPLPVRIDACLEDGGNVTVTLKGYARGTVCLAETYAAPPDWPDPPLTAERPEQTTAGQLYTDRWMFHGPAFQRVAELGPIGDDGIRGILTASDVPGALLDNAGQLMGFWIMRQPLADRLAFPQAIGRVSYYGPPPARGQQVSCVVRIKARDATSVTADLELRTADRRLWAHLHDWTDRRFTTDEVTWPVFRFPESNRVAEDRPGGYVLARERWPDSATRELLMRRYLSADERAEYQRRTPRAQRQWLLGRIALKDAVRGWLWSQRHRPIFPAQIRVSNDRTGRPVVTGPFADVLSVSLAHSGPLGVALVIPAIGPEGALAGIDVERITDTASPPVERIALVETERVLLDHLCAGEPREDRAVWLTRFWAAKEAAAKAEGTGLAGDPRRFVVEQVDGERLVVSTGATGRTYQVATQLEHTTGDRGGPPETYVVAWTASHRREGAPVHAN
jgi:acyl transferase domain-containing protein/phosphopantetheinyl transferase